MDKMEVESVDRVVLAGAFGAHISPLHAMALGMIGDNSAVPTLREALLERNLPQLSTQAAMALCLVNDRNAVAELTDMLFNSNSKGVKTIAARGLTVLGDAAVVEELLEFITTKRSLPAVCDTRTSIGMV